MLNFHSSKSRSIWLGAFPRVLLGTKFCVTQWVGYTVWVDSELRRTSDVCVFVSIDFEVGP